MLLDTSLYFKTFLILISELGILFGFTYWVIHSANQAYKNNTSFMGVTFRPAVNMKNQLDLVPSDSQKTAMIFSWLTFSLVVSGIAVTIISSAGLNVLVGIAFMTINAISIGIILGFIMLEMDENDGVRAIYIVMMVTVVAALIGTFSGINFANRTLAIILFVGLLMSISFNIARISKNFARKTTRNWAIFGSCLFVLYLMFDFNMLLKLSERTNDWNTALFMAYSIYLDIINLLLEILDAMGNS